MVLLKENHEGLLQQLEEGGVFEHGMPFSFAPKEKLTWTCIGVEPVGDVIQYTFHVHFMGVMLRAVRARLDPATHAVDWEG